MNLDDLLAFWQDRLALSHWDIKIRWASRDELGTFVNAKRQADSLMDHAHRHAIIRVLNEEELDADDRLTTEEAVVHELTHAYTVPLVGLENEDYREEELCNVFAKALVALREPVAAGN